MCRQQIVRTACMPFPLAIFRHAVNMLQVSCRRTEQMATIEQRDEVPANIAMSSHDLIHHKRHIVRLDRDTQFVLRNRPNSGGESFLESDYAARNMPARSVVLIFAPGKECFTLIIFHQQVDIDQGRKLADEQEGLLRQAFARIANGVPEFGCQVAER
ncbi:MAG: hypothetical protein A3H93_19655 [Rhodocyclales bacterium RIFCSPLOWO2_02_FULL_63_24]|nr:MAG: hypothetical protein A3H93_19655 [Rhodocyclales bacterium RIFCSPLOWO2_02_FULL_63_24]